MGIIGLFTGLQALQTGTTGIRVISASSQLQGGFGVTRVISGSSGFSFPTTTTPGSVGSVGGGGGGGGGFLPKFMQILNVIAIIHCITALFVTGYKLLVYFKEPAYNEVRSMVNNVDAKTGVIDMFIELHDYSGLFVDQIKKQGIKAAHAKLMEDWFEAKMVAQKSETGRGGYNSTSGKYEKNTPLWKYEFKGYKPNIVQKWLGGKKKKVILAGQGSVPVNDGTFINDFVAILNSLPPTATMDDLDTEVKEMIVKLAELNSYEEDDNCKSCGDFNLSLYPDHLHCMETRYSVRVKSASNAYLTSGLDVPKGHGGGVAAGMNPKVMQTMFTEGILPAWLNVAAKGTGGADALSPIQINDAVRAINGMSWDWIGDGAEEPACEFNYKYFDPTVKQTTFTFHNSSTTTDNDVDLPSEDTHPNGWADVDCADPYYWESNRMDGEVALPGGYSEGDTQWEMTHGDWKDGMNALANGNGNKSDLFLDPWGIPNDAIEGKVSAAAKNHWIRSELTSEKHQHWQKSLGGGATYQRPIKPYIFNSTSIHLFPWNLSPPTKHHHAVYKNSMRHDAAKVLGVKSSQIPTTNKWPNAGTYERAHNQYANWHRKFKDGAAAAAKNGHSWDLLVGAGSGPKYTPQNPMQVRSQGKSTPNHYTGFFAAKTSDPSSTCATCKAEGSDGCGAELQAPNNPHNATFWTGMVYVYQVKKEVRFLADTNSGGGNWETLLVDDMTPYFGTGKGSEWSTSEAWVCPCLAVGSASPEIVIGDVDKAYTSPLGQQEEEEY